MCVAAGYKQNNMQLEMRRMFGVRGLRRKPNRCVGFNAVWVRQRWPSSTGTIITTLQNFICTLFFSGQLWSCFFLFFFSFSFCGIFCLCLISSQIYSLCSFVTASFTERQKRWMQMKSGVDKQHFDIVLFGFFASLSTHRQSSRELWVFPPSFYYSVYLSRLFH